MHVHTSAALVWWERWAIHRGPGISWGRNTKPCLNQQQRPTGSLSCAECVCVCVWEREAAKQPPADQRMFPCSFSKHSLRGLSFLAIFTPLTPCSFIFFPSSFQKRLLEARIYLFSHCCFDSPISQEQMLCLGSEKDRGRGGMAESGAHSVAGRRAESSCCGVDLTDAPRWHRLGQPKSASLYYTSAPSCLRSPLICVSWNSIAAGLSAERRLPSVRQWWRISSIRQCKQCISTVKTEGNSRWGKYGVF